MRSCNINLCGRALAHVLHSQKQKNSYSGRMRDEKKSGRGKGEETIEGNKVRWSGEQVTTGNAKKLKKIKNKNEDTRLPGRASSNLQRTCKYVCLVAA